MRWHLRPFLLIYLQMDKAVDSTLLLRALKVTLAKSFARKNSLPATFLYSTYIDSSRLVSVAAENLFTSKPLHEKKR